MIELKNNPAGNFFLLAGPCVIEGEDMAMRIAERVVAITDKLQIPYVFKGSYRKANRSRLDSFMGIGDEKALKILKKVHDTFGVPTVTDIHAAEEAAMAAEYVDILQIPAFLCRQTDLLVAAAKTGKTVNIKKGQFLSPLAMQFAADKVVEAGNKNVMITERGTTFGYQDLVVDYRGIPEMQTFGFPVILDVTHSLQQPNQTSGVTGGMPQLIEKARKFDLKIIAIRDLIAYRLKSESLVEKGVEVDMPTEYGHFRLIPFRQKSNGLEHIAIIKGEIKEGEPVLVRVHSSCATGDIFGSMRCDCGEQLHKALQMIEKEGKGAVVYLNQEGRGIGLMEKMKAYKLQEDGMDTVDANICLGHQADERDYGVGAEILRSIGITKMRLLTNNPVKRVGLESYGLSVVENIPIETTPNKYNERYLKTKKDRMGHTLHFSK